MDSLHELLVNIDAILQKEKTSKEESLRRGERFNVFQICGVDHYEVMHSTILASILNPDGSHGQRDKFLKIFLSVVDDKIGIDSSSCSVFTEYVTDEGRIDILIEDNKGKGIIIENKVYAADQDRQLIRYDDFSKKKYGEGHYAIYYLTLDGHEASEGSGKGVAYFRISYSSHILAWLEECIKESVATPLVHETLIQYKNHIKQLTNQDMDTYIKEELLEQMANNASAVAAILTEQEEYKRFVFNKYVIESPILKEFCKEKDLIFVQSQMFVGGSGKGFYFHKPKWKSAAIWFYTDRSGEWDFYWGISHYDKELDVKEVKLDCFSNAPTNYWPYGWEYLNKYRNWDWNTYAEMVNGNFSKYVKELVLLAIEEIEKKSIHMP